MVQLAVPLRDRVISVRVLDRIREILDLMVQMQEQTKESVETIKDKEVRAILAIREPAQLEEARVLKVLTKEVVVLTDKVLDLEQVMDQMAKVDQALKELVLKENRVLVDRTVVDLKFQEERTPLLALVRKSPAVVIVTPMVLDSVSRVIATASPSMVSSPGWWQF